MLHTLLWLRMMLHSPHPWRVVLNSLLTKAIGEHGMESSTREQRSMNTMVLTWGRRTGRTRRTSSPNGMDLQMFARLELYGVAALNSLPHLFIELHSLLRVKSTTQHTQSTPNT